MGFIRRTMSRTGAASGSLWKGSARWSRPHRRNAIYIHSGNGSLGILGYRLDEHCAGSWCWRMVMETRTSILRHD